MRVRPLPRMVHGHIASNGDRVQVSFHEVHACDLDYVQHGGRIMKGRRCTCVRELGSTAILPLSATLIQV